MSNTIYIYNGPGAFPNIVKHTVSTFSKLFYTYQIKILDSNNLLNSNWCHNASLLIMPGGTDLFYVQTLNGKGNQIIKGCVYKGMNYII